MSPFRARPVPKDIEAIFAQLRGESQGLEISILMLSVTSFQRVVLVPRLIDIINSQSIRTVDPSYGPVPYGADGYVQYAKNATVSGYSEAERIRYASLPWKSEGQEMTSAPGIGHRALQLELELRQVHGVRSTEYVRTYKLQQTCPSSIPGQATR